jgi:hypothetical protein
VLRVAAVSPVGAQFAACKRAFAKAAVVIAEAAAVIEVASGVLPPLGDIAKAAVARILERINVVCTELDAEISLRVGVALDMQFCAANPLDADVELAQKAAAARSQAQHRLLASLETHCPRLTVEEYLRSMADNDRSLSHRNHYPGNHYPG